MRTPLLITIAIFYACILTAQDNYHQTLQNTLQTDYQLPAGDWVFHPTEADNLESDFTYGDVESSDMNAIMQLFARKVNIRVNSAGDNQWDAGYGIRNLKIVETGSACLAIIWLRAAGGNGEVNLFLEDGTTYDKEVYLLAELSDKWRPYFIPFETDRAYAIDNLVMGLHIANKVQEIEIGGLALLDYGTSVSVDDLPDESNRDQYGGYEADAPWRAEAADRIEQIRKADLTVRVLDDDGNPIPNANVSMEMLEHDYGFGSAVVSSRFAGNTLQNETYESKLTNFDGNGHGFNCVVFENSLKWPGWESNWISSKEGTAAATTWLANRGIKVRGHTLLWPGWSNMPGDMEPNQDNPDYLKTRVLEHIKTINQYPGIAGNIAEWDVLNEITSNRDLEYALAGTTGYPTGREFYPEVFRQLHEVDSSIQTFVNDYVTISQARTTGGTYDLKKQFIQEIIDSGVRLDGVGFQAHIGASPTSIYKVYDILEDFHQSFGLDAKITEYDTDENMGDTLAGVYLRDFLTMVFSHPSTNGFLTWGFWDGAHWKGNAPFFYEDWTMKPAAHTFIDLVYNEWWTNDGGMTNTEGAFRTRGFKGRYRISIDCGSETLVDTITLIDDREIVKRVGAITTSLENTEPPLDIHIYPNPANRWAQVRLPDSRPARLDIFDGQGRLIRRQKLTEPETMIPLNFGAGRFYFRVQAAETIYGKWVGVVR